MIQYIKHDSIDIEKWDACIDKAMNGLFYAYGWYLDMTAETWDALVEDDYKAVMPLPYRRKAGISYLFQPFFIQQLGVFSTTSLTPEVTSRFLNAIPDHFRFGEMNLNTYNQLSAENPVVSGKGVTHELDLIAPYEQLRRSYSENTRRNIKKATRKGVFITSYGRPEEMISAFRRNRGRRGVPFSEKDYHVLKHLIYAGIHRGLVSIKFAYSETNNFCAGIVFYKSHQKAVWLFSGATPEARENGAMSMLVDEFIRDNAGQPIVLDFEGSKDPNLARFYRGFGSEECVFLQIKINRLPLLLKPLVNGYLAIRKHVQ
ncbi:MAG: GNAT family N-acetyltransferase [Bacteroidales bacterium]